MARMAAGAAVTGPADIEAASFDLIGEGAGAVLALKGDWTLENVPALDAPLRALSERIPAGTPVDVAGLGRMDVAGAYLVDRTIRASGDRPVALRGEHAGARRLLEVARASAQPCETAPKHPHGVMDLVDRTGRRPQPAQQPAGSAARNPGGAWRVPPVGGSEGGSNPRGPWG